MKPSRRPSLIIVTGHPATGKTTFARRLSVATGVPLFTKDDFKELLYESLGAEDREASRKLGLAAYSLLERSANTMLSTGQSLILESNFDARGSGPWIGRLEAEYIPTTVQVFLHAELDVILRRFSERSDQRHPAHFDDVAAAELRVRLTEPYEPLAISGNTLRFDTTNFSSFDTDAAIAQVNTLLNNGD